MSAAEHPSPKPSLNSSTVATLLEYIRTERDDALASPDAMSNSDTAAYVRGLQYGIDAIIMMWASAVVATKAVALDLDDRIARGEVE